MADLRSILGGPWSPPAQKILDRPEVQLANVIREAGLLAPEQIIIDGQIHRFTTGTKGKSGETDKSGYYVVFPDSIMPSGCFGDWRSDIRQNWHADVGRELTPAENIAFAHRSREAQILRDAERKKSQEVASDVVSQIWSKGMGADPDHPYLSRKQIQPHGARITGDGRLMVPLFSEDGELCSIQYISQDGTKRYHDGASTGRNFWQIGTNDEPGTIYIAEGYATASSIHEATNRLVIIAYSASNLVPVLEIMREKYGKEQDIVIVADNDASGTGQRYAEQAAAKYGARIVMPPMLPGRQQTDANDYVVAGQDLALLLNPAKIEWLIHADEFSAQPAPISWLIKHWAQKDALMMIHGPSGGGKTFVVLDWCLRIASNMAEWANNKVNHGPIVYLAGEGHHGLRGRVAAWKHHHKVAKLNMWLSKAGCDLNTSQGYMQVVEHISQLPAPPVLIVVDTLHRFLSGDENSAQDAKTMLDACAKLMQEYNCSVALVHHTGVSEDAQHRARGSSAWKGALDIEVSIVPGSATTPLQIIQRKSKDAELAQTIHAELLQVAIPGWIDEDGEQVTSAVINIVDAPVTQDKPESKLSRFKKQIEAAWFDSGAEMRSDIPYISRSGMGQYLAKNGRKERTILNDMNASRQENIIGALLLGEIIEPFEHGWIVKNMVLASIMKIQACG